MSGSRPGSLERSKPVVGSVIGDLKLLPPSIGLDSVRSLGAFHGDGEGLLWVPVTAKHTL
ncbi:hypothetical protein DPMN_150461 [Dreissena polymorpha]|uniref:Uncharacterized protein n=1 Tax=Dreissena polymorpha TaxID=45954 RepID=A0A9D4FDD2_DREPO|nr:hypothetical protein DPMN_150461 [Dreissena polymorpha]